MQALRPFQRYADFSGRSGRAEFWQWIAMTTLVGWVLAMMDGLGSSYTTRPPILSTMWTAGTIVPQLAVAFRRLHDVGRSGRLYLIMIGLVILAAIVILIGKQVQYETGRDDILGVGVALAVVWIGVGIFLMVQFCRAGDEGSNVYGPPDNAAPDTAAIIEPITKAVAAATAPRPRQTTFEDNLQAIERLGKMREQGLITEDEFAAQKKRLLDGSN